MEQFKSKQVRPFVIFSFSYYCSLQKSPKADEKIILLVLSPLSIVEEHIN